MKRFSPAPWTLALAISAAGLRGSCAFAMNRPFSVGGYEGGGPPSGGLTGWLLNEQSQLTHMMSAHIKALGTDPNAMWAVAGLGLAYGVFHAAGPGHGKALIASYMMASDRAVKRGVAVAFVAALLQGAVAIALVGVAALVFNATAHEMNLVADGLATSSYAGIVGIGGWLIWRKGRALNAALQAHFERRAAIASGALYAGAPWRAPAVASFGGSFQVETPGVEVHSEEECGHPHAPDPAMLGENFSWRGAFATVVAVGSRPCSGSILVLVFALAQGAFLAGIGATIAISLGTAVTTGALAFAAVYAKSVSMRLAAGEDSRTLLVARGFEFVGAVLVLVFGLALWFGANAGIAA